MTTSTKALTDQDEAIAELLWHLKPGMTVRTILRHCTSSGMTRYVSAFIMRDGEPWDISHLVNRAFGQTNRSRHEGVRMGGCGMDMGFSLVYHLSRILFPDGHTCTGIKSGAERCPSNDHSNDYGVAQQRFWDESGESPIHTWTGDDDAIRQASHSQHTRMRAFIRAQLENAYATTRVHSDGGYALNQRWF